MSAEDRLGVGRDGPAGAAEGRPSERADGIPLPPLGDVDPEDFRRAGHAVIDWIAGYLADPEVWPVLPSVEPGDLRAALPASPPDDPEPFERILSDFERLIPPATTHWNHPGFMAYFANTGSGPSILAEALSAALNANAMLWRTAPAATELERLTLDWLRQLLGLPAGFEGVINDTASTGTLCALVAAREAQSDLRIRRLGLAGRADLPPLRVYCSQEAHSSVDKAAIVMGVGESAVRRVGTDADLAMDVAALESAIADDLAKGVRPIAVVATVGTTSTGAIDPVPEIAEICQRHGLWLHVDAAYGGAAAVVPEHRSALRGADRADSVVVNPHKWLFVPLDCSALYSRRPAAFRAAFSLAPEYLRTTDPEGVDLMDYGIAMGRRFRALKLWFVLRRYGSRGIADRLREHIRLASLFASWVRADPAFECVAQPRFSLVVFRCKPLEGMTDADSDTFNEHILARVNDSGEVYLSHTRVGGRIAIRLAIGNAGTMEHHVARAWHLVRDAARAESERWRLGDGP